MRSRSNAEILMLILAQGVGGGRGDLSPASGARSHLFHFMGAFKSLRSRFNNGFGAGARFWASVT